MNGKLVVLLLGVALVMLPGCGKKSGEGQPGVEKKQKAAGAASAEAGAKGFVEAAGRRDQAEMARLLLGKAVCEAKPKHRATCLTFVKEIRAMLPEMMKGIPKGFKAARVEIKAMPGADAQNVKLALVHPKGGGNPLPLMIMEHEKRFYVGVGIKSKKQDKKQDKKK